MSLHGVGIVGFHSLPTEIEKLKYDVRTLGWCLRENVLKPEDHEKRLSELPDLADACETVDWDQPSDRTDSFGD